ncbi:hypothetical protein FOMPIDRAFT_91159 [Fomitopsis schrenkii]|uniref:Uncharacterized protein n=1 Tax=Fomitopsis schrenkii TaxID=2126942 RepID=S8DSL9_FOMSC|nr:hypothetical protein FOMPIDRAFT_91159 [Fomitopsis schrenkii]
MLTGFTSRDSSTYSTPTLLSSLATARPTTANGLRGPMVPDGTCAYCVVVTHEPDALPSPLAVAPVMRLLDYFDSVFESDSPITVKRSGVPYTTLAWSESSVTEIQNRACNATPADPLQYSVMPMYLDDFRSLLMSVRSIAVLVDSLLADSRSHTLELRKLTDCVEGIALTGRDAPLANVRNIPARGIPTVAKMVLHQFEPPKCKKKSGTHDLDEDNDDCDLTDWDKELQEMMEDLDFDEEDENMPGADDVDVTE